METRAVKQRIYTWCYVILTIIWKTSADTLRSDYDSTHVRVWTGWYNTDRPETDAVDDESVGSIRKRGYEVCDGNAPIDAVCRDLRTQDKLFNSETLHFIDNYLAVPCNAQGLVCKNEDQFNKTCGDYEIKFECLKAKEVQAPENLGVIGVAAGLSVIVPILCVAIMHMIRLMKERRNGSRQSLVGNSEMSVQTDTSDLPPSYSCLFGENNQHSTHLPVSGGISLTGSSGDLRLHSTRLSSSSITSDTENHLNANVSSQGLDDPHNVPSTSDYHVRTSWRSRFPNMHISIFDIFSSPGQRSGPASPDPSYVQTPPPTYKDAIIILGGQAYNLNENGDIGEKI